MPYIYDRALGGRACCGLLRTKPVRERESRTFLCGACARACERPGVRAGVVCVGGSCICVFAFVVEACEL